LPSARQRAEHGLELEALDRKGERVARREARPDFGKLDQPLPELAHERTLAFVAHLRRVPAARGQEALRRLAQRDQRRIRDAAERAARHDDQCLPVVRVERDPQQRRKVADFRRLVERAAGHDERNPEAVESELDERQRRPPPGEHRDPGKGRPFGVRARTEAGDRERRQQTAFSAPNQRIRRFGPGWSDFDQCHPSG
jgi:hypothetical protein